MRVTPQMCQQPLPATLRVSFAVEAKAFCLFIRISFTTKSVVIVLIRPAYPIVAHWISDGLYSAELRSLKRPDDEDGDSEVLAEKKIGVFQPVSSYSPNLIRFEYDNLLTLVSPVYGFSDRGKTY